MQDIFQLVGVERAKLLRQRLGITRKLGSWETGKLGTAETAHWVCN